VAGNFDTDVDTDGRPDLAVPNAQVSILLNHTIVPSLGANIDVTVPDGGEIYTGGTIQTATWTSAGFTGNVKIDFFNGVAWKTVVKSVLNTGTAPWKVPKTATPITTARIRICSVNYPGICNTSLADFTVNP
jgi:hypothetical protein